jgi:hypothetical protein
MYRGLNVEMAVQWNSASNSNNIHVLRCVPIWYWNSYEGKQWPGPCSHHVFCTQSVHSEHIILSAICFRSQTTSVLNIVGRLNIVLDWSVEIPALCNDVSNCSYDKCTGHRNLFRIKNLLNFFLGPEIRAIIFSVVFYRRDAYMASQREGRVFANKVL